MSSQPIELRVEMVPSSRFDAIDVVERIRATSGDVLNRYQRALYCSHHTTAGFFDQSLASRLQHRRERMDPFIGAYRELFPQNAGYTHDQMHLRTELSEEERRSEPPNADAHLTFIGSGLRNCVTYDADPRRPVYFMDLDGVFQGQARTRTASVVAYRQEQVVREETLAIPVPRHAVASVNLGDERLGLMPRVREMLAARDAEYGRIDVALDPEEHASALTVNEFETLLMRHDLAEVLENPLRFMATQGRRMLRDPRAVPAKSIGYAKYDLVQLLNRLIDALGLDNSAFEQLVNRFMAFPASRLLRFKRAISLAVSPSEESRPRIICGRYQSPILIQWEAAARRTRRVRLRLTSFA